MFNAHGDVVHLTDSAGAVTKRYHYDAFGNEVSPSAGDGNPWRYCGEYFDGETGTVYLRARYYDPGTGRFGTEDPIRDGLNWYTYCANNPIKFKDPSGMLMAGDEKEFGKNSDTYKILDDLGKKWNAAKTQAEKDKIHQQAEIVRMNARNATPIVYAQDKISNLLKTNSKAGVDKIAELTKARDSYFGHNIPVVVFPEQTAWAWLGVQAYNGTTLPGGWNYKFQEEWKIPIDYKSIYSYDFDKMQLDYHDLVLDPSKRGWVPYMYFEGQIISADLLGNINLGYVGTVMGFDEFWYKDMFNLINDDSRDQDALQLGIDLANRGR